MGEELEGRIVTIDEDEITIYDLNQPGSWFSAVYQNSDTKSLDERFGLTGEPVEDDSEVARYLALSTGGFSLGKTEVECVLRYFAYLAKKAGNFVGLPEEELKQHVRDGDLTLFSEGEIDLALRYQDGMNSGATYLKRMTVEGKDILFPANLRKLLI